MKVGFKNFILLVQGCTLGSTGVDPDHKLSNYLINSDPSVRKGIGKLWFPAHSLQTTFHI